MAPNWQAALVSIVVSLVPGLLWLWFFRRQDVFEPEPKRLLLLFFAAGMASVIPAFVLEYPWRSLIQSGLGLNGWGRHALIHFVLVAGVEESAKMTALSLLARRLPEFDEPLDGIIYGVTVGLGFAALENLLYTLSYGAAVGGFRAVIASLAHASFTGWLGYFVTIAKFGRGKSPLLRGLAVAIFLHGTYNTLLLGPQGLARTMSFVLIGLALVLLMKKIRDLAGISPYRPSGS